MFFTNKYPPAMICRGDARFVSVPRLLTQITDSMLYTREKSSFVTPYISDGQRRHPKPE